MRQLKVVILIIAFSILTSINSYANVEEYTTSFDPIIHGFTQRNDNTFIIPPDEAWQIGKLRFNLMIIQGCCYGFTHTALNYYFTKDQNGNSINTNKDEVLENGNYILKPDTQTAKLIRKTQMQNIKAATDIFVGLIRHLTLSNSKSDLDYTIHQLKSGNPVPLLVVSLPSIYGGENIQASGHSVLTYKCSINTEQNECVLYIHDPNYPRKWNNEKQVFEYDYNRKMVLELSSGNLIKPYESSGRRWQIWAVDTTYSYKNPLE